MTDTKVTSKNPRATFPHYLLCFALVPALPFLIGVGSLAFFIDPAAHPELTFIQQLLDVKLNFIEPSIKDLTHLANLLDFLSIASVHIIVCLLVISFLLYQIHQLPVALIKRSYIYLAVTIALFALLWIIVQQHASSLMITQLGYKSTCILMSKAALQSGIVGPDPTGGNTGQACFLADFTRLVWLAWVPLALGIITVVFASAFSIILASGLRSASEQNWRIQFLARIKLLQKSFYMLSLVLVTSTICMFHFLSLPLDLLTEQPVKEALILLVNGNTTFLGSLFTATLFVTFAPAVWLFYRQVVQHSKTTSPSSNLSPDLTQWLHDKVFVSTKKQMANAIVMVAPMLVGPLSNMLQQILM